MTAPAHGSTTPLKEPGSPPSWVRRFADRSVDLLFNTHDSILRRAAAADASALLESFVTDPALAAPTTPPSPVPGLKIGERAEALLRQPDIPPDVAIRIRQDIRDLPEEAQVAWLEAWQDAKRFAEKTPGMPEDYPLNTAWKAVNSVYEKTEVGWTRRTAAFTRPEVVEQPGGKTVVMLPTPTGGGMEKKEVGSREEAAALIREWQERVDVIPARPSEDQAEAALEMEPSRPGAPPQREPGAAPSIESIPESPSGRPLVSPVEPLALAKVMDRLRELAAKPEGERTDAETKEAHRLIDQVVAGGYRLTADDWKTIREKGFAALEKSPQDLLRLAEPKPGKILMEHLQRGLAGGRLISILEDPAASRADKEQAEEALVTLFRQDPSLRQLVSKVSQRRRTTAAHDESGQEPTSEGEPLSDGHWDRAVRGLVRNLRELLTSDKASEDEKTQARRSMGQLMTAASLGRTLETTVGERLIAAAEEVRIMPRTAQVEFDAKIGKYNVLHASLLKPLTFASKDEAEKVSQHLDGGMNPQVTKTGDTFQVSHPDWERPVAARTASDAQTIVEHKLRDLGDNAEDAKTLAQTITQAANAEVPAGDTPVATAPQALAGDTKPNQEAAVQINANTHQTKQTGAGSGDNGAGLPKSTSPLVSGFPNTNVATPHGKHPNVPGTVSSPEGPAVPALAKGTTPDAEQLKTDNKTKFDAEVAKVNRAHGLVRATQEILTLGSAAEATIMERKIVEARAEIAIARVTADMTPEAKTFFEKQMGELAGEDKPDDQKVAIAFAKTREQFPSTPEK